MSPPITPGGTSYSLDNEALHSGFRDSPRLIQEDAKSQHFRTSKGKLHSNTET